MDTFINLFIPGFKNNQKAKLLHNTSIFSITIVFVLFQFVIFKFLSVKSGVLGYAASIPPSEVVRLTNEKRVANGLSPLTYNQTLSSAAYTKGTDMINRDYWAHVSPDGTQPWKFFSDFGYKYRYAGENLARDFNSAQSAVDAWMNSPSHRENILNPKYKEIGIGVVEGDLAGVDTTIIVQFFGSTYQDRLPSTAASARSVESKEDAEVVSKVQEQEKTKGDDVTKNQDQINIDNLSENTNNTLSMTTNPESKVLISPFTTTKNISLSIILLLIFVYVLDSYLVSKRKITRITGRAFAHVTFLLLLGAIIVYLKAGKII